jgi:pyroglutamyl-peptidase
MPTPQKKARPASPRAPARKVQRKPARPAGPILVTGFEPFGGHGVNPSAQVAEALHGRAIDGVPVVGVVLPCAFGAAIDALRQALHAHRPQLVLALGQAGGRSAFSLERVAINIDDAAIPDNAGAQPVDRPVVADAPAARFSTLPIKAMAAALREAGQPAEVSNSAGTFVCNHLFYGLQHLLARKPEVRSGFMHLPLLPSQAHGDQPCLPLATMLAGTAIALHAALRTRTDLAVTEGTLA